MASIKVQNHLIMDYKKTLYYLLVSLLVSPILFYIVYFAAKAAGAVYEFSHGETFIIWILMAILVNLSIKKKE